ncbi:MAG: transporter substrate-binding domain-containing protein [Geminicoccaceae bacterium]
MLHAILSRRVLLGLFVASIALGVGEVRPAAATGQSLKIAVEGEYPPFNQVDKKGKFTGFDVDIANAICKQLAASCKFVQQPWPSMIDGLIAGDYDLVISSLSITNARRQRIDFSEAYYTTPAKFVAKKDLPLTATLNALKGRKVAVQKATTHERYLASRLGSGVEIVRYETLPAATADLAKGKVDVVFADALALSEGFLQTAKGKSFAFVGPDLLLGNGIGIGVKKGQPDLVAELNRALDAIRADGSYSEIGSKYFPFKLGSPDTLAMQ